ncbi:hypothetical protein QBC35DRAFT_543760 [Podospora australis]|uniref:Trichothecene 3-O-acetyltransferase n=1 Tax=Podospora australis TaxID=1536484 RepID=A0AAN6WNC1_9PEZI|nr:hypothetical protein QBC35DRAFT_543760 [Podospora australis]
MAAFTYPSQLATQRTKEEWINHLAQSGMELPLTRCDNHAPSIYFRVVYGFGISRSNQDRRSLAGQVSHEANGNVRVKYSYDQEDFNIYHQNFSHEVFRRKDLVCSEKFPYENYDQLVRAGVPPSHMDKGLLSLSPNHPTPPGFYHPLTLQANFMPGGLLICFSCHHKVLDGKSFTNFLEFFSGKRRLEMIPTLQLVREQAGTYSPANLADDGDSEPPFFKALTPAEAHVLTFGAAQVDELYAYITPRVTALQQENNVPLSPVSKHDLLCGLVWYYGIRRYGVLDCSSWIDLGSDISFGMPGTPDRNGEGGNIDWCRKTYSANDGSMNILPRHGRTRGNANWEVLLALHTPLFNFLLQPTELRHYILSCV